MGKSHNDWQEVDEVLLGFAKRVRSNTLAVENGFVFEDN